MRPSSLWAAQSCQPNLPSRHSAPSGQQRPGPADSHAAYRACSVCAVCVRTYACVCPGGGGGRELVIPLYLARFGVRRLLVGGIPQGPVAGRWGGRSPQTRTPPEDSPCHCTMHKPQATSKRKRAVGGSFRRWFRGPQSRQLCSLCSVCARFPRFTGVQVFRPSKVPCALRPARQLHSQK